MFSTIQDRHRRRPGFGSWDAMTAIPVLRAITEADVRLVRRGRGAVRLP